MKLVSSTGDFSHYVPTVTEKIRLFGDTKFRYLNLEQTGNIPAFFEESDTPYRTLCEEWGKAAEDAGVTFLVSHAPCLHNPCFGRLTNPDDETYKANIRAIRRSIENCKTLGIPRIVVHACTDASFSKEELFNYNKMFYDDLLPTAEKCGVMLLTENWDNDGTLFSTGAQMREFIDYIDHPLLAGCWDTAHGNIAASSRKIGQYDNLLALGDKLKGMHISDNFGDTHHHNFPFAGIINFDSIVQGLLDVKYDGPFTFEASYTLLHQNNLPYNRKPWVHNGLTVTRLLNPSAALKQKAVDLLYETGKYILETYGLYEG